MQNRTVRVKVPASTANLGSGFDAIGFAFQLYTTIRMREADKTEIQLHGKELADVPRDQTNLLYEVAAHLYRLAGKPTPELYIEVETETPLARGLGSSASAIVGALVAANLLAGEPFSREELLKFATHWEGHPDNVAAALFGGIVIATLPEEHDAPIPYVRLPVPIGLQTLVVIPDYRLSTEKARQVLPATYSRADFVYNIGHSSLLVAALAQGRLDLLAVAMRDRLHQPYRAALVPGLTELIEEAPIHGALGAALSGAGPTMLFFFSGEEEKERLLAFINKVMIHHQLAYRTMELLPDEQGIVVDLEQ